MYKCKNCNFETNNKNSLGAHVQHNHVILTDEQKGKYKRIEIKKVCLKCKNVFNVERKEKKDGTIIQDINEKKYCSRACANSRIIIGDKKSIKCFACGIEINVGKRASKKSLCEKCKNFKNYQKKDCLFLNCNFCKKDFLSKNYRKACSLECKKKLLSLSGRKASQNVVKRSKAEIYFFELCKANYQNIDNNKNIFFGWDADIILHDFKIAILYNGKWHYEKITEKHSLEQVQNRDRIKIKKIIQYGYLPYIIKDIGKFNKNFVQNEFLSLQNFIKNIS